MIKSTVLAVLTAALLAGTASAQPDAAAGYRLTKSIPLGAPERWDYVVFDRAAKRVYVAHGDHVNVVDGTSGAVVGEAPGGPGGVHGIAISTATGKGYTDDGQAGVAIAFNLKTLKLVGRIPGQKDADGVTLDRVTGHVFVVNGDSKSLTVIDPKTDTVVATIDTGGGLEYAVGAGDGKVYVNGAEKRELLRIDARTNRIDARWPLPDCQSPHGLAIDRAGHRAFVTCMNRVMMIVNTETGAIVAHLPIGLGTDAAAFDPKRKLAFSSNADGTISVVREVDPQTFESAGTIKTRITARTMAIDPATGRLFVAAAKLDPSAPPPVYIPGHPWRPKLLPGSLELLFIDPAS
ncbi:MAG TPA: YncE family protein [Caulobacteraceae bacterium]|nr:YncE family protein [Caulobacteraceae bacterium]